MADSPVDLRSPAPKTSDKPQSSPQPKRCFPETWNVYALPTRRRLQQGWRVLFTEGPGESAFDVPRDRYQEQHFEEHCTVADVLDWAKGRFRSPAVQQPCVFNMHGHSWVLHPGETTDVPLSAFLAEENPERSEPEGGVECSAAFLDEQSPERSEPEGGAERSAASACSAKPKPVGKGKATVLQQLQTGAARKDGGKRKQTPPPQPGGSKRKLAQA